MIVHFTRPGRQFLRDLNGDVAMLDRISFTSIRLNRNSPCASNTAGSLNRPSGRDARKAMIDISSCYLTYRRRNTSQQ